MWGELFSLFLHQGLNPTCEALHPHHPTPCSPPPPPTPPRPTPCLKVPDDTVSKLRAARLTAIDMIGQSQHMSFSDIQSCLHAKRDTLIALDPTFTLELNFLACSALPALQDHLHSEIFKVLPTSTRRVTIQQARWVLKVKGHGAQAGAQETHTSSGGCIFWKTFHSRGSCSDVVLEKHFRRGYIFLAAGG